MLNLRNKLKRRFSKEQKLINVGNEENSVADDFQVLVEDNPHSVT